MAWKNLIKHDYVVDKMVVFFRRTKDSWMVIKSKCLMWFLYEPLSDILPLKFYKFTLPEDLAVFAGAINKEIFVVLICTYFRHKRANWPLRFHNEVIE